MTDKERIASLEMRIAQLEARLNQVERSSPPAPIPGLPQFPQPQFDPWPKPYPGLRHGEVWCGAVGYTS